MVQDHVKHLAEHLLTNGFTAIPERDRKAITRIAKRVIVSTDVAEEFKAQATFGERLADRVAAIGGSWGFILTFLALLAAWAVLNTEILAVRAFDPYPYVFLNLILSMLAAIQAPVIMMSQNRQAAKDRIAAAHDYDVNLKAEVEIMSLHEKLDQLRSEQLRELLDKQHEQVRLLAALVERRDAG